MAATDFETIKRNNLQPKISSFVQPAKVFCVSPGTSSQTTFPGCMANFLQSIVKSVEKSEQEKFSVLSNIAYRFKVVNQEDSETEPGNSNFFMQFIF